MTPTEKPFRIVKVECSDTRLECTVPEDEKTLHVLPVTFTAGDVSGKVSAKILIQTTLRSGKPLEVPVNARVIAPAKS